MQTLMLNNNDKTTIKGLTHLQVPKGSPCAYLEGEHECLREKGSLSTMWSDCTTYGRK